MTEQHPLTDSKALSLFSFEELMNGSHPITIEDAMRKAADWQLEQVIAWLDDTDCDDPQETAQRLRKAMRPQQQEDTPLGTVEDSTNGVV